MATITLLKYNALPPQIPLFFSKPSGEDQLADTWFIVILPILMNLLIIANNIVTKKYFADNVFVKKVFYYLNICY